MGRGWYFEGRISRAVWGSSKQKVIASDDIMSCLGKRLFGELGIGDND